MPEIKELPCDGEYEPRGCFSGVRKSFTSGWATFKKLVSGQRTSGTTFEISNELSNPLSREYKLLKRKACKRVRALGDRYVIVGPYPGEQMSREVSFSDLPPQSPLYAVVEQMRLKGIEVFTGRWKVKGKPILILFDIESAKDDIFKRLCWNMERDRKLYDFIDRHFSDHQQIVFEHRVAEFFDFYHRINKNRVIADNIENPVTISRLTNSEFCRIPLFENSQATPAPNV